MKQVKFKRRVKQDGGYVEIVDKGELVELGLGKMTIKLGNGDVIKRKRKDLVEVEG